MLHIADRLGRSACFAVDGETIPLYQWRWKPTSDTCKKCAAIYRSRRHEFVMKRIEGETQ
jgi:hypothetical protein